MPESTPFQCRHIFADGHRCGSRALRQELFCFYHHTSRPATKRAIQPDSHAAFAIPALEDRAAIGSTLTLVAQRIAAGALDSRRAGLLLYALQIASANLPKPSANPTESIDEIILDELHGPLAPIAALNSQPTAKTLEQLLQERWQEATQLKTTVILSEARSAQWKDPVELTQPHHSPDHSTPETPGASFIAPLSHAISGSTDTLEPTETILPTLQASAQAETSPNTSATALRSLAALPSSAGRSRGTRDSECFFISASTIGPNSSHAVVQSPTTIISRGASAAVIIRMPAPRCVAIRSSAASAAWSPACPFSRSSPNAGTGRFGFASQKYRTAARFDASRLPLVERANRQLALAGIPVLGVVVNGVRGQDATYGNYAYSYNYPGRPAQSTEAPSV